MKNNKLPVVLLIINIIARFNKGSRIPANLFLRVNTAHISQYCIIFLQSKRNIELVNIMKGKNIYALDYHFN